MAKEVKHSCIDCAVTLCDAHNPHKAFPAFCISRKMTEEQRNASLKEYFNDPEDKKVVQVAATVESDGYKIWPRVQETIEFAKRMGFTKIGIATCVALIEESRMLAKMLRAHGFEVYGISCKAGEVPKTELGIHPKYHGPGHIACNPILQAQLLAEEGTEFNIVMGLCVGHDSLFYKYSKALTTTLVVKDRVLMHNTVMPLYTAEQYYQHLLHPPEEEKESE